MNIKECFKSKDLSKGSLELYITKLTKLNDNKPIKNLNFLKSVDAILKKIEKLKPNTQRTYIISICSLLKCIDDNKNKKLYDTYSKLLEKFNNELKDQTEKTETENENWITQEQLKEKYESLLKIATEEPTRQNYFNLLVIALYYLIAPRRNKDYQLMKVIKEEGDKELSKEFNYIDINNKNFIFNNYKTSKTYKTQIEDIPEELFNIINNYINIYEIKNNSLLLLHPITNKPFLLTSSMTLILNKIFGGKISSSMLRKSYLTHKYSNKNKELEEDAKAMGTSVNTANNNYIKKG